MPGLLRISGAVGGMESVLEGRIWYKKRNRGPT
jgi:hypothetical protein